MAAAVTLATLVGVASPARAGNFTVTKSADSVIDTRALTLDSSVAIYGIGINGNAFENSAIQTYNGWQYAAYWVKDGTAYHVALARRQTGSTAWQVANLGLSTMTNGLNGAKPSDAHNVVSLGIDRTDGTLHLAYDMHGQALKYRVSQQGVATNPNAITAASWSAQTTDGTTSLFNPQTSQLVTGTSVPSVTYPHFINTPSGDLQFTYRTGSSGNGSNWLADYTGASHTWGNIHQYDDGTVGTYNGTVTVGDPNRNSYINGITYGPTGRMYQSFTWREGATGAANHDINFVYSDDKGNTWKNNAGTVVGNAATGLKWNLNSPGLVVVPIDESQSLMNQQTQAVTSDDKFHTLMWHRDTAKPNTGGVYTPTESSYFDYWRDNAGGWHRSKLPGSVGSRPKLFFDANNNAFAIYQVGTFSSAGIYINNGDLVIAAATKASNWTDWKVIKTETGPFVSEAAADAELLAINGTLSVVMQNSPTVTTPAQGTNLRALDYSISLLAPTDRTLAATGSFATAANWSGSAVPAANANAIINAGRTATLSSAAATIDNSLVVGAGGTGGTFALAGGGSLTVGASVIVGRDGGSVGTYTQTGGTLTSQRFVVGDYFNETSGGGASSATVSGGTLTTAELQVAMAANAAASGSSFNVSGTGNVTVNGEVILGEAGSNASLNVSGGTMTVAGDIREGFNGSSNSAVNLSGGTLNVTANAIKADVVTINAGTLQNVLAINTLNGTGGTITRTDAATATLTVNDGTFGGSIQNGNGTTSLNKVTAGTLILSGANTFTGGTTITAGVIRAQNSTALGGTAGNTTIGGGAIDARLELAGGISLAEPLSLGGRLPTGTAADAPHVTNVSGTNTLSGTLTGAAGGNQYNVSSNGGKLIVTGSFVNTGTSGVADIRYLKLMGAAEGAWQSVIANNGTLATTAVTKMGDGLWTLSGANTYTGITAIKGGTLSVPASSNVLTNAGGVDLADGGDGTLAVTYTGTSPAGAIDALLTTAAASAFGSGQIRSSDLVAGHTIGLNDNGIGSVRVRVTLAGDADLNGSVDFNDFLKLQNSFGVTGTRFDQGDFNYDGVTNFNDFLALQNNFGQSVSGAAVAVSKSQVAAMTAFATAGGVPEPASLAIVGIAAAGLLRRRRMA